MTRTFILRRMKKIILILSFFVAVFAHAQETALNQSNNVVNVSFASSNIRFAREQGQTFSQQVKQQNEWTPEAWRGEKVSIQIVVWSSGDISSLSLQVHDLICENGQKIDLNLSLNVLDQVLPSADKWKFDLDFWQHPAAIARVHNVPLWSEEHFKYMRPYYTMLADAAGPMSSIRFEKMIEGIQDFEKIRIVREQFLKKGSEKDLKQLERILSSFEIKNLETIPAEKMIEDARSILNRHNDK